MKIVKTYEEGEYTINEYDNGVIERYLTEFPPNRGASYIPTMSEDTEVLYQMASDMEMLLSFAEINGLML